VLATVVKLPLFLFHPISFGLIGCKMLRDQLLGDFPVEAEAARCPIPLRPNDLWLMQLRGRRSSGNRNSNLQMALTF
jgi:hypothetical protein